MPGRGVIGAPESRLTDRDPGGRDYNFFSPGWEESGSLRFTGSSILRGSHPSPGRAIPRPCGPRPQAESMSRISEASRALKGTAASFSNEAPSPACRSVPPAFTRPRSTCSQAPRPGGIS
jgi:hypothetical protein